jgi:hypothetical protein
MDLGEALALGLALGFVLGWVTAWIQETAFRRRQAQGLESRIQALELQLDLELEKVQELRSQLATLLVLELEQE